ncbi:hypothetical protein B0H10DRAFT_2000572 [Mycena sp. CBHHK59/15]|nr:hypothetical protein B0H10DRAFT_2000572 [Mycena sp. CBHHK59/15]
MMLAHCIFVFFALFILPSFSSIVVDAPESAVSCQPVELSWQGGTGIILDATPPNPALENLGSATTPFTWDVNLIPGNGNVILEVKDSTGAIAQSVPFTIQEGSTIPVGGRCTASASTQGHSGAGVPQGSSDTGSANTSSSTDTSGSSDVSGSTDTSGSADTGSSGISQSSQGGSVGVSTGDGTALLQPSPSDGSNLGASSFASTRFPPSSSSTSASFTDTKSSPPAATLLNSAAVSASGATESSSTALLAGSNGGEVVQTTPPGESPSPGIGQPVTSGASSSFAKKNIMSGSIIGAIITAVLVSLLAAFYLTRRCRRRRLHTLDRLSYSFSNTSEAPTTREVTGRSGYSASAASSWGNQGDLSDDREAGSLSPTTVMVSAEGQSWEADHGTIESRYAATFTPRHSASSLSIDRNDPSSQPRFRGPNTQITTDARHFRPSDSSAAILGEQLHDERSPDFDSPQSLCESRIHEMPSWTAIHHMTELKPIVGYPPPYTSY